MIPLEERKGGKHSSKVARSFNKTPKNGIFWRESGEREDEGKGVCEGLADDEGGGTGEADEGECLGERTGESGPDDNGEAAGDPTLPCPSWLNNFLYAE